MSFGKYGSHRPKSGELISKPETEAVLTESVDVYISRCVTAETERALTVLHIITLK